MYPSYNKKDNISTIYSKEKTGGKNVMEDDGNADTDTYIPKKPRRGGFV